MFQIELLETLLLAGTSKNLAKVEHSQTSPS